MFLSKFQKIGDRFIDLFSSRDVGVMEYVNIVGLSISIADMISTEKF